MTADSGRTWRVKTVHGLPHRTPSDGEALWNNSYRMGLLVLFGGIIACGVLMLLTYLVYRLAVCCRKRCCCKCKCVERQAGRPKRWQLAVLVMVLVTAGALGLGYRARGELVDAVDSASDAVGMLVDKFEDMHAIVGTMQQSSKEATVAAASLSCASVALDEGLTSVNETLNELDEVFEDSIDPLDSLQDKIDGKPKRYVRAYFAVLLGAPFVLSILLGLGASCTGDKCPALACCQLHLASAWAGCIGLPVALVIFAAFFVISMLMADICYIGIEDAIRGKTDDAQYVAYYVTCEGTNPFESTLTNATAAVDDLTSMVSALGACTPADSVATLEDAVDTIADGVNNITTTVLDCAFVHDTVDELFHTAICDKTVTGLVDSWFCIGCAGLLTLLLLFAVPCANTAFFDESDKNKPLDYDETIPKKPSQIAPAEKFI